MRFVSSALKRVVYPALSKIGYLHRYAGRAELSVITYHGVLPEGYEVKDIELDGAWVTCNTFRRQLCSYVHGTAWCLLHKFGCGSRARATARAGRSAYL